MRQRKANKILMAIVLILLCLVLITTSVVSGIFAKYTAQKQIRFLFGFESFGLRVEVFANDTIRDNAKYGYSVDEGGNVTINNLLLHPGEDFDDAITIKVSGNPTTNARVSVTANVTELSSAFTVPQKDFDDIQSDTVYMPIGFKVNSKYVVNPYSTSLTVNNNEVPISKDSITSVLNAKIADTNFTDLLEEKVEVDRSITFGFDWVKEYGSVPISDEIGTWISNQKSPTFTVVYSITVEQVGG